MTIDDRFPSVPPELEPFVRATVLTPGQARTAALLSVTAGETRPEVLLAVALAVTRWLAGPVPNGIATQYASTCLTALAGE